MQKEPLIGQEEYFAANREGWNRKAELHKTSKFYDVDAWKQATSLTPIEIGEMGDVAGKTLLHPAQFVCCNLYDLPQHLAGEFDIVFTSYGVSYWLPDMDRWAAVISHFVKLGGFFYIADFHPIMGMFDDEMQRLAYPYHNTGVIEAQQTGTYATREPDATFQEYGWSHSLSETVNSLVGHGLRIEFLNEYSWSPFDCFHKTLRGDDGNYRIQGLEGIIPMVYSIKAVKAY